MKKYLNRQQAGQVLAAQLSEYANRKDVLVYALPRGGVPVAFEIAQSLHIPLDVYIVRKLGVPGSKEYAFGAISMGNASFLNDKIIADMRITQEEIDAVVVHEMKELLRRELVYRGHHTFPSLKEKTIILVDDGIATGATMRVAIQSLRKLKPNAIIVAVPVAEKSVCDLLESLVDQVVCPLQPESLIAVGAWYEDFLQTEDKEVFDLLQEARLFE